MIVIAQAILNVPLATRKIFIHALLHSVRHWAQLATYLRQKGYKQDWQHDFIASGVIRKEPASELIDL